MFQRTFVLVKPDGIPRVEEILGILDQHGERILQGRVDNVPKELIERHYESHKGKYFYQWIIDFFEGQSVVPAIYQGEGVVQRFVEVIGHRDPSKAPNYTIRGRFSDDSEERAIAEKRHTRNVIHRAGSLEEAEGEGNIWMQYMHAIKR